MACLVMLIACSTTQKKIAYQTLYGVETSTTAAYDGFISLVIDGKVKTNGVPAVSQSFNRFQIGMQTAISTAQFNYTNLAPNEVIALANEVLTAILKAKGQ